ncbi:MULTISPECIES: FMN-dependent NADH-azoreductase [Halomonas]|uniref:FMN dependent NADH:quinone oxidoreductase n=1 Tax=Halomonas halophila TaxID=29573 RepID=A0ABQ0U3C1_9GAMM|nr:MULTISPECIES: NAD(P)H-dependent oxidoreductase [Halomonas]MDR5888503.1 NAD(P)H-dependent oxidoreductase [Halomonas salina]RAH37862.1 FMN-dependent NADH-azoreductase [Halomonas sp. SL1]WJY07686.1 NAD(P)H-dependent oxidoreductase [Halomonas halophila]GEK73029.1 FMN-dependent NADH-azoreductase [Halomonas halophila]
MTRVLVLTSSILGGNSQALADHFSTLAGERDGVEITRRDLVADDLPHLGLPELASWQVAPEERDAEQRELAARSDALIKELLAHDVVVLGVPMYNLGVPSQMKAWFDRVLRAGVTFRYTENGPVGLIEGKRAILLAARGGEYAGSELDSQTPHLTHMLGLMGIGEVDTVFAEGLNMGEAKHDAAMNEARQAIAGLVERL